LGYHYSSKCLADKQILLFADIFLFMVPYASSFFFPVDTIFPVILELVETESMISETRARRVVSLDKYNATTASMDLTLISLRACLGLFSSRNKNFWVSYRMFDQISEGVFGHE
jgi:hypothetical protein